MLSNCFVVSLSLSGSQFDRSKCFVHIPSEKRRKLDDTALEITFLGYDNNSKAFRCYNNITKRVVISRDVRFTDCMFNSAEKQVTLDFRSSG